MQAIEFTTNMTNVKNGVLNIPMEHVEKLEAEPLDAELRVIILKYDNRSLGKKHPHPHKKQLSALQLDTRDIVFDRDEANER